MKHCITILLSFFIALCSKAQALGDINSYLNSSQIPKIAKLFYEEKFKASDDDSTFKIIDSLKTRNNFTRPFYLLLCSKMIAYADGALAEGLFPACEDIFEKNPDVLIEFLYSNDRVVKKYYKLDWAMAIAGGIELAKDENVKQYLSKMEIAATKKCKYKNQEKLKTFYAKIYEQL